MMMSTVGRESKIQKRQAYNGIKVRKPGFPLFLSGVTPAPLTGGGEKHSRRAPPFRRGTSCESNKLGRALPERLCMSGCSWHLLSATAKSECMSAAL
jgi:hypothetical protein